MIKGSCLKPAIFCAILFVMAHTGCERKDRLSASTFPFSINPPAASVVKGETKTLQIVTSVAGEPTWTISHSTVGSLNTTIGNTVVFTGAAYGDVNISATLAGVTTISQVTVVSAYVPGVGGKFDIYSDAGIPVASGDDPDIFVSPANTPSIIQIAEQTSGSDWAPEGVKLQRTVVGPGMTPSWGVTFDFYSHGHSRNLTSSFDGKSMKFFIRLHRVLVGAEGISARIESVPSSQSLNLITGAYMTNTTNWQEVSIPLANFVVDKTQIKVPFAVVLNNIGSSLTFDIDAVRWE